MTWKHFVIIAALQIFVTVAVHLIGLRYQDHSISDTLRKVDSVQREAAQTLNDIDSIKDSLPDRPDSLVLPTPY